MKAGGVRISGGELKGRVVRVATRVRPTEGRVREALFSIWTKRVAGARMLDLFAGSGAVGIEALGRGAREVVFVEKSAPAIRTLRANLDRLAPAAATRILRLDLPAGLRDAGLHRGAPFDLVFADPPYRYQGYGDLLDGIGGLLSADGEAAIEHARRVEPPGAAGALALLERRAYGESCLSFYAIGSP